MSTDTCTTAAPARHRRLPRRLLAGVAATAATTVALGAVSPVAGADQGRVFAFGEAETMGEPGALRRPVAAITSTPSGEGYWVVAEDGGVFTYGDAVFAGSAGDVALRRPVVAMAATPSGKGYWFVASDGGVFSYGDAAFHGSLAGMPLSSPIVGMASTADGAGYWLVAADGGVFTFGNARFMGSMGGQRLNAPIVGVTATPDDGGYWLAAADGGVFAFGAAPVHAGPGFAPSAPITGITSTPSGQGYWLAARDGGIYSFGDAEFKGSLGDGKPSAPITDIAARPDGDGYWVSTGAPPPPPPPPPAPRAAAPTEVRALSTGRSVWDAIAQCESGGRWNINTGNGYYGGVQFSASSWRAVGGTGLPHQHSREVQIQMAERLQARQGWGAWPHCTRKLGLR